MGMQVMFMSPGAPLQQSAAVAGLGITTSSLLAACLTILIVPLTIRCSSSSVRPTQTRDAAVQTEGDQPPLPHYVSRPAQSVFITCNCGAAGKKYHLSANCQHLIFAWSVAATTSSGLPDSPVIVAYVFISPKE